MERPNRYHRQVILPEVGEDGQERLGRARVAVIGLGALGCVASDLLARSGVGYLRLVDRDVVELVNLQRQPLYSEADLERPKADAAAARLRGVNTSIAVEPVSRDLHAGTLRDILRGIDLIVDGTDNMETRFLLNEAALDSGLPFVYGGAIATYGMVMAIWSPRTACFRCWTPHVPPPGSLPTCDTAGILNAVSAQVGALQAGEAMRLLLGREPSGDLLVVDGWRPEIQRIHVARRSDCPACVAGAREFVGVKRSQVLASICGSDTISVDPTRRDAVDLDVLGERLEKVGAVRRLGSVLLFEADGRHLTIFPDGRALIRGVKDEAAARTVYAKYVGG